LRRVLQGVARRLKPREKVGAVERLRSAASGILGLQTGEKLMATSLYDLSVPTFLQTVKAIRGFLDRAAKYCAETGADPDDFVHARLFDDMAPFHFQIEASWHHSVWGLEAIKTGVFAPPALIGPVPFADLQVMIGKAETALEGFTPEEVNSWAGKDLNLQIGPRRLAFTPETLILSFSLPNFYFHAVTAYDILRMRGVPLGKRDYEGRLRTREASAEHASSTPYPGR
jgi:hypothetical protein